MAYGYPYQMQQPVMPSYFNTNYAPPIVQFSHIVKKKNQRKLDFSIDKSQYLRYNTTMVKET